MATQILHLVAIIYLQIHSHDDETPIVMSKSPCLEAHNHPFGMCSTLTSQSTVPAVKRWRCFAGELAQLVEGSLRSLDKIQRQYDLGNMP